MSEEERQSETTIVFTSPLMGDGTKKEVTKSTTTLIILNSPINVDNDSSNSSNTNNNNTNRCFDRLWELSDYRICADGGANRLYSYNPNLIPDRIRGDLDSIHDHVKEYYERLGVNVEGDPCQDTNDLDKAIQVCTSDTSAPDTPRILIYGAFGGRFDQEMASIQALYKWGSKFQYQMFLYSHETCAILLPPNTQCHIQFPFYGGGTHNNNNPIDDDESSSIIMGEGPTCGLIPLGSKCESITTDGFQWDLDGTIPMEFGGLVSTSNRLMKSSVSVRCSHPIIFTAELIVVTTTKQTTST